MLIERRRVPVLPAALGPSSITVGRHFQLIDPLAFAIAPAQQTICSSYV